MNGPKHVLDDGKPFPGLTTAAVEAVSHENDIALGTHGFTKTTSRQEYLRPNQTRSRSPDTLSIISADEFSELRFNSTNSQAVANSSVDKQIENGSRNWIGRVRRGFVRSWFRNKGLALVLFAQVFGTFMGVSTRMLEMGSGNEEGLDPFQILFARMSITSVAAMAYMWYTRVEHFPLGAPSLRLILVLRGTGGFFGVWGMYWSLKYLPLADATVLSFLGPPLACYICSKLLKEPFGRMEQIAVLISLVGVVLIARPTTLFSSRSNSASMASNDSRVEIDEGHSSGPEASPQHRMAAVGMAMVGVLGAACAYTTIRWIGKRAHPLISVNYFALWTTVVSGVVLAFVPSVPFILPHTLRQWALLLLIGVSGFVMQFLLTAGLAYEKSSRANNMVYSQMIFALAADAIIWGHFPSALSLTGSSLILGSAIVVAVQKGKGQTQDKDGPNEQVSEEREGLMQSATEMEEGRSSQEEVVELQDQPGHTQESRSDDTE